MSIDRHAGTVGRPRVTGPDAMVETVLELGLVPFFENPIRGYSIEEMTPPEFWFEGDELGPWDWKIACVRHGSIAYGKFLWGGKAAFATVEFYRELRNWRRSLPKYSPAGPQQAVLDYVGKNGSISIKEVRGLLGVKKSAADAVIARLQQQTRLVTGDILRVYRGADLHYNGWQTASFCTPESLFGVDTDAAPAFSGIAGFPFSEQSSDPLATSNSPQESLELLKDHVRHLAPHAAEKEIEKLLG